MQVDEVYTAVDFSDNIFYAVRTNFQQCLSNFNNSATAGTKRLRAAAGAADGMHEDEDGLFLHT